MNNNNRELEELEENLSSLAPAKLNWKQEMSYKSICNQDPVQSPQFWQRIFLHRRSAIPVLVLMVVALISMLDWSNKANTNDGEPHAGSGNQEEVPELETIHSVVDPTFLALFQGPESFNSQVALHSSSLLPAEDVHSVPIEAEQSLIFTTFTGEDPETGASVQFTIPVRQISFKKARIY